MHLSPRPAVLLPRSAASFASPSFSCPSDNSDSGLASDVWQNHADDTDSNDNDEDNEATSTAEATASATGTADAAILSIGEQVQDLFGATAVPQTSEGATAEGRKRRRARVRRDGAYTTGMWTQGQGCAAEVEEVKMGQGWFVGATGQQFGVYGCNLTDSEGTSKVTWHSASAQETTWDAILCIWTNLDSSKAYSASIVNSPSDTSGHGWIWVNSNGGFRYHANAAETGLFTLSGPQVSTVPGPTSSATTAAATDESSTFSVTSSSSSSSATSASPSSSSTVKDGSSISISNSTWLWLALLGIASLACLTIGCLCFRKPATPPSKPKKAKRTLVIQSDNENEDEKALGKAGQRSRFEREYGRRAAEAYMEEARRGLLTSEEDGQGDEEERPLYEKKRKRERGR